MVENTKNALSVNVEPGATGIHWFAGDDVCEVTTADKKFMTQIRRLAKVNPDVIIDSEPNQDSGGFMLALVPVECLKLGVKRHVTLSEERKTALAKRLKESREK